LTPHSTIFLLYRGVQFYWWRKTEDPQKTTDLSQVTDKPSWITYCDRHCCDHNIAGFITTYAISCLWPLTLWGRIQLRRGVLDTTLCEKVCQWLATGRWFSAGPPFSSTNKTERHDITEILLNVASNTITLSWTPSFFTTDCIGSYKSSYIMITTMTVAISYSCLTLCIHIKCIHIYKIYIILNIQKPL
jgi:hypothetical protein